MIESALRPNFLKEADRDIAQDNADGDDGVAHLPEKDECKTKEEEHQIDEGEDVLANDFRVGTAGARDAAVSLSTRPAFKHVGGRKAALASARRLTRCGPYVCASPGRRPRPQHDRYCSSFCKPSGGLEYD